MRAQSNPISDQSTTEVEGKVVSVLAGTLFKVRLKSAPDHFVLAHIHSEIFTRTAIILISFRRRMAAFA